jgi:hypothetical protein
MRDCRSDQRSNTDALLWSRMGSIARLHRSGVMIIENGQLTMVASGSMASLATIESPDEATVIVYVQRSSSR